MASGPWWIDTGHAGRLAILPRPRGGDWVEDDARAWARAGLEAVVSLLEPDEATDLGLADEETAAEQAGVRLTSLPVPDRGVPDSRSAVARLATTLAESIVAGKGIGVHCRQGVGRSAVLAACILIALGLDPVAALSRVAAARGLAVPETQEQRQWVMDFARSLVAPV
jgi:protein-tyrosine phosphatase